MRDFHLDNTHFFGANFIPSNAINQLEMWQEDTFSLDVIERELGYAKGIGMNIMRVFLHDLLWEQDPVGLISRMDSYLSVADALDIKTMFVFFDDCWKGTFALGKQPDPVPFSHNSGWIQSPGNAVADDLSQRPRLEKYVKGVMTHFANDRRIAVWDLYNEPGNGSAGDHITKTGLRENLSLPLLTDVFKWAGEVAPSQPYTAGVWNFGDAFHDLNQIMLEHSDIVTFHTYGNAEKAAEICKIIKEKAGSRPIICTEYMARHIKSNFADILPVFKKNNIGAINWGLVSGKTQTIYPWDSYQKEDRLTMPFHDIFEKDGSFLVPDEYQVINKYIKNG